MTAKDPTLHLPRLLCLHGGGVNADVFHAQCRVLRYHLECKFRLCFADGPFLCDPHPGIVPVYQDFGPFRRWLRWLPQHAEIDTESNIEEIDHALQRAMDEDNQKGATGEWVGLLGFSQGAILSASLLYRQQVRCEKLGRDKASSNFRFAVLMAGRAPILALDPPLMPSPALLRPSRTGTTFEGLPDLTPCKAQDHILHLPTVHVHGLQDPDLSRHRHLLEQYCEKAATRLVEWHGEHRVPIKRCDVDAVVKEIMEVAVETGVLSE